MPLHAAAQIENVGENLEMPLANIPDDNVAGMPLNGSTIQLLLAFNATNNYFILPAIY